MATTRLRLLAFLAALAALATPAVGRADAVTDWNAIASNSIVVVAGQAPHASTLSFAMVQGAVYDAVNGIDRSHQPYLAMPDAQPWDSKDAATATAAFRVLAALFPAQQSSLQASYDLALASIPNGPAKEGGVDAGEVAAAAMLAARTGDGRGGPFTVVYGTTPGAWRLAPPQGPGLIVATDPAPWLGNVKPFLVPDITMLRTDPPNPLTSGAYAEDFNEVKELGSLASTRRTPDETEAAIFWQDHGHAIWNRVLRQLVVSQGLDVAESARLLASVDLAAADAAIGCWNNKYYWNFWRPITAIREAASDGNPATEPDPNWLPLFDPATPQFGSPLVTPGFPDHPAGHGCVTGSVTHMLQDFFGTDKVDFSAFSNRTRTTRSFDRFSAARKEVIDARVWGGIHFRTADVQGAVLGKKVAHYLEKHYFLPMG